MGNAIATALRPVPTSKVLRADPAAIALRDFGLLLGALSLSRLASAY